MVFAWSMSYPTKRSLAAQTRYPAFAILSFAKAIASNSGLWSRIYSTCSVLSRENEDIISWALSGGGVEVVPLCEDWLDSLPRLPVKLDGTLCVMPDELYEGFYIAKLKKVGKSSLKIQESKSKGRRRH